MLIGGWFFAMRARPEIERELEHRVEDLGYELVDFRWGGSGKKPLLRLRIDRPDSSPGHGVTVDDCASVSRALEPWLDGQEDLSRSYVLEVSSPGVERPLVRDRDFDRFRGERVVVKGHEVLHGESKRLDGELIGLKQDGTNADGGVVVLRLSNGEEVDLPRRKIRSVHLAFTWK